MSSSRPRDHHDDDDYLVRHMHTNSHPHTNIITKPHTDSHAHRHYPSCKHSSLQPTLVAHTLRRRSLHKAKMYVSPPRGWSSRLTAVSVDCWWPLSCVVKHDSKDCNYHILRHGFLHRVKIHISPSQGQRCMQIKLHIILD